MKTSQQPQLLDACDIPESDIGTCGWDPVHNSDLLTVSANGTTVYWGPRKATYRGIHYPPAWVPASTRLLLHSGTFSVDFLVDDMVGAQLGVGFLLGFEGGLFDWGFYGYLGAGLFAWAYDPSTGDVVTGTESIQNGLPTFADRRTGVVSLELDLPRTQAGRACFRIQGIASRDIALPLGAVVKPAACFLKEGQRLTLGPIRAA